ncbi:hypothetical protein QFC21_003123 [Naganishia friedmannii]|uniref:Uncharacterized protein n=1 Tax=Naganishia friedmannii TaxID=89922 RepID=A0ACC2VQT1_9TREE|nr:hypothetical protein QFC21_003123 [Naganishia friedmannii]
MGQKASKPAEEPPVAEQRNATPPAPSIVTKAPLIAVKEARPSPPANVVSKTIKQQPVATSAVQPRPPSTVAHPITLQAGQAQAGKVTESRQVQGSTPSAKAKSKLPVVQQQQIPPKHEGPVPIVQPKMDLPPATQKQQRPPVQKPHSSQHQPPAQKPQQSAQKPQQPAHNQPAVQKQLPAQKQQPNQKQPVPQAKQQGTQSQQTQQKHSVQGKPQTPQTLQGKPAKQPKQKKGGKQGQQQQPPRTKQVLIGRSMTGVEHTKLPSKPVPQPVGGSLRARMSSPPKLISAQAPTSTAGTMDQSSLSASAASPQLSASGTVGRTTEKRRLEEVDDLASIAKPKNLPSKASPRERAPKVARREGDMDASSALSLRTKPPSPSPPPAILSRLAMNVDDEKEEGEISDEEMQEPSPPPTGRASLLERLGNAPVSGYSSSPAISSNNGIGSLAARMDPALMARIDPRGSTDASSNRSASRVSPVVPAAVAAQARYQAHVQARNSPAFGQASAISPAASIATVIPAAATSFVASSPSTTVVAEQQPRTKGVIGRSGNMTTVNGVAISTGGGHGESQLDEAGQRELIEIVVELHNKGIPSHELIQRGVPAQLVNRVMKALSKPAPASDVQPVAAPSSSHVASAPPTSLSSKPVADLSPKPISTSTMSGTHLAHSEVDHDADVDMDIDESEHEKSPRMGSEAPFTSSAPGFMQFHPGFIPPMHMMPMPFPVPSVDPTLLIPLQHLEPSAPPLPPASSPQPPPPPPAEAKLSLKEMKAKLLASRKAKQQSAMETDGNVLQPSDVNTLTFNEGTESMTTTPRLNESLLSAKAVVQEVLPNASERAPSPTPSPIPIPASFAPSVTTRRIPSPKPDFEISPTSAVPSSANSRRPGAADFVDAPPSRLASSTFFRSTARKTFAPPQPKRLVVDLDDTSDESGSDGDDDEYDGIRQSESELYMDEATSLRLEHEAELRIALERKKAELVEKRAKLAAYAARKKAAAQLAAETAAGNGSMTPDPRPTGSSVTPPLAIASAPATPPLQADVPLMVHATAVSNTRVASNRTQDKGKQKEGGVTKSPVKAEHRPTPITVSAPSSNSRAGIENHPIVDLTSTDRSPRVTAAITAASSSSAHFKPYQFFTPPPPSSSIHPNPVTNTDILDLEALKKITLSRMMAEHRQRTGKAEEDPVVCKYELRGGACNVPDCRDFHMERDVVASQQDLMRYIDVFLPAKKNSPPHMATVRQHLQQLVRSKPDVPPKTIAEETPEIAKSGIDATATVLKAKLKRQRQAKALQARYQARKTDVEQFLNEMRKTLQDRASVAGASR